MRGRISREGEKLAANDPASSPRRKKARRGRSRGGPGGARVAYWLIRYVRSPFSDLKDSTV